MNAPNDLRTMPSPSDFIPNQVSSHAAASETDFLADVPEYLVATRKMFEEVKGLTDKADCQQRTREVFRRIQGFATTARAARMPVAAQIGLTLATLLKKLSDNPNTLTPSTFNTVCKAIAFLEQWCVPGTEEMFASH